ncbi:major facilitator superfamily protein [Hyaloraphidium curvatum]|nr:major facilitator superfamily protein [Hyaloraphidium curvatum]
MSADDAPAAPAGGAESPHHRGLLDLVDLSPMTALRWALWFLAAAGTLLNGFSLLLLGVALPLAVQAFGLDSAIVGIVGAALVFGSVPGSLAGGRLADHFGRKPLLIADLAVVTLGALLSALANGSALLIVGQLVVGFGIGMDFPVGSSYIAETVPSRVRPRLVVASIALQSVGMVLGAAFGLLLVSSIDKISAWRWLMGMLGMSSVVFALARLAAPESPRWLMLKGRSADAARSIARLAPKQADEAKSLADLAGNEPHVVAGQTAGGGIAGLFAKQWLRRTLLVSLPWLLMDIATYGVALFTPIMIGAMSDNTANVGPLGQDVADARSTTWVDISLVVGALLSIFLVPWLGHLPMQEIGFVGMTAGMLVMAIMSFLPGGSSAHIGVSLAALVIYNLFMNAGPNATTYALAPEIFPTQLRGSASGFASSMAKVGATIGAAALPPLQSAAGPGVVLAIMAGVSLAGLLATWLLARGVKIAGGSLEERHRKEAGMEGSNGKADGEASA